MTKKQLRIHIHTHLGRPRIVLRRVTHLKTIKKKHSNTYWLDPEKKGSLKLTLKKQNFTDPLKLKLKKSSESEDFTVVKSNINLGTEIHSERDVAGAKENDQRHEKDTESSISQPFENVMVEQQVCCTTKYYKLHNYCNSIKNVIARMNMEVLSSILMNIIHWKKMIDHP